MSGQESSEELYSSSNSLPENILINYKHYSTSI